MDERTTIILGFHLQGNPPFWPAAIKGEPYVEEERPLDHVSQILSLARTLPAAFSIAGTNWRWLEAQRNFPSSFGALRDAVFAGAAEAVTAHAYGAHTGYLSSYELWEELNSNRHVMENLLGLPPEKRPILPENLCVERDRAALYNEAGSGVFWPAGPHPSALEVRRFGATPAWPVWNAHLTQLNQVLRRIDDPEVDLEDFADEYAAALTSFLDGVESGATVAMWYPVSPATPETHFEIIRMAWKRVLKSRRSPVFALPPAAAGSKEIPFSASGRVGSFPMGEPILSRDGRYDPPGEDAEDAFSPSVLYRRHPFVLWESGLPLVQLLSRFSEKLGLSHGIQEADWIEPQFRDAWLNDPRFLLRYLKQSDLWKAGYGMEAMRSAAMAAGRLIHILRDAAVKTKSGTSAIPFLAESLDALRASLGYLVDNPLNALEAAGRNNQEADDDARRAGERFVRDVREHRLRAAESLSRARAAAERFERHSGASFRVIDMLDAFARELAAAVSLLDAAWTELGTNKAGALEYLARIYPPQVPLLLERFGPVTTVLAPPSQGASGEESFPDRP